MWEDARWLGCKAPQGYAVYRRAADAVTDKTPMRARAALRGEGKSSDAGRFASSNIPSFCYSSLTWCLMVRQHMHLRIIVIIRWI